MDQRAEQQSEQHGQQPEQRRVYGRPFPKGVSGNPHGRAGAAGKAAEVERLEAERLVEVGAIVHDLGREPTAVERLLIDELAALAVRARRLRSRGEPSDDVARLMARIAGRLGMKLGAAVKPAFVPLRDQIAARKAAEAAASAPATMAGCDAGPGPKASPGPPGAAAAAFPAQTTDGARPVAAITGAGPSIAAPRRDGGEPSALDMLLDRGPGP